MKTHKSLKVVAVVLSVFMLFSAIPMTAFAAWQDENVVYEGNTFGTNGYYNVISKKDYTLVPGAATETEMVINNSAGNRRQVMHIMEVDPSNPDISIVPGYYGIDKDLTDVNNWKAAGVTDVAKYYENELGYNVVGAMNTSLAYDSNAPIDFMVYNGVNLSQGSHHAQTFLAVIKDPETGEISCELHAYGDGIPENCWQAVSANFGFTVKDGQLVSKTEERTSSTAARSMLGIKEDGTLVIVMNDGRGANNSVGFNNYELGESMLALGCKWAVNCDGGGSSSFVTKRAGETEGTCRCVPCDGAERPTINSILITSNVGPTGELNDVKVTGDYDYFAPGTTYTFGADAIDTHGYAMDMPADASWSLSDSSFGTISNGTFVSNGTLGDVDIQVESAGNVVGSKTITVANPESLTLSATSTTLPYSTADKPRKVTLPIVAKIGEADVYLQPSLFNITSSVAGAGTIDGFVFTATTDETIAGTAVTATYVPTDQALTYTISFGKGSETLWDFEDGDISNWYGGSNDVKQWLTENGVAEADQLKTLISGGQISFSEQSHTFLSTRENGGQVHNGNSALGVNFDFRNVEFNSWVYALLFNVQDQYVLRDVANGKKATALGMWCYVPEGFCNPAGDTSGALSMQLTVYKNPEGTSGTQLNFQFYSEKQKKRVSLNQCTEADIPENRWVYLTADLTGSNYYSLTNPKGTTYREPSFFRMYIKPTRAQELTYYFDDFTLDYSSAVDDRDAPLITNPTYCTNDTNIEINNQTINTNTVSFNANIADYAASNSEGLDYSTAAIYADGVKLNGVTASGNTMGVQNVVLSDGTHAIKFEIYDNAGNFSSITRNITIDADPAKAVVTLSGHNDSGNTPEYDSVYYADLVASDIAQIDQIQAVLKLNTANTWELDNMIAAQGFEASYTYNTVSKLATVTVKKTGKTNLTGQQTLVSIPARVWSFDESTDVGGDGSTVQHLTAAERFNSSYGEPKVFVDVKVDSGSINYTDNSVGYFGGSISVPTKLTGNKSNGMWHQHTAEAVADKAATCTEDGYTNRTYCETCGSVVDWGTKVPATGHNYVLNTSTKEFVCSTCGDVYDYSGVTGPFEVGGYHYAAIAGNLVKGWQNFDDGWYFFNPVTYHSQHSYTNIVTYSFEDSGKLISGEWYDDGVGKKYYYGPDYYRCNGANPHANVAWVTIDGDTYGFDPDGYRHEGIRLICESNKPGKLYEFTDEGVLVGEYITDQSGLFYCNGQICYLDNGTPTAPGLIQIGDDYYYFTTGFVAAIGKYNVTRPNGLMPAGTYEFGPDGKLLVRNGVFDGFLYIDGVVQKSYQLVEFEGDYYFINDGNKVAMNKRLYLSDRFVEGSGLVAGYYEFDEEGKMILKDGLQDDGSLWIMGVKQTCYKLIQYNGDWYFINDGHKVAKNARIYLGAQFTEGTPFTPAYYEFDSEGKLIIKNGPQADGFFYVNGVRQNAYQLVNYQGDWYFINDGHKIAKNARIYLGAQFTDGTPFTPAYYEFDSEGKLIIKNGPWTDGYFYVNGVRQNAYQLVNYQGDWYFINDGHKLAKDRRLYLGDQFVTGTPFTAGYYEFDSDGKLIVKNGPWEDGYFYLNGVRQNAYQLIKYNDKYYFIDDGNKYAKNKRVYLSAAFIGEEPLEVGYYQFGEDGSIQHLKYYTNNQGEVVPNLGMIFENGEYYYVRTTGQLAVGSHKINENKTNDFLKGDKTFNFDENGVMDLPAYYIKGIRDGRDVGVFMAQRNGGVKGVDGRAIKTGMLLRGGEIDGAINPYTNQPDAEYVKQYAIDVLKNTYGVKTEIDLRNYDEVAASQMGATNPLGDDVTHNYYNMCLYDNVFTADGKAKIKAVFDDLSNADNAPVFIHCTYGLDRTGIICFLLEGALGIDEWSCVVEYCTTKGSDQPAIDKVRNGIKNQYNGANYTEKVVNFLKDCGVTDDQIQTLRDTYLEASN